MDFPRLLRFAQLLQRARDFGELLTLVRAEVVEVTGYVHAWLYVFEPDGRRCRLVGISSDTAERIWERAPILHIDGDQMLEQIRAARGPVVVDDARTDPRTDKQKVEETGVRTVINIPLVLGGEQLGSLGIGTFADEGTRPPTEEQLEQLTAIASQVMVAAARLKWSEEQAAAARERAQLQRRLEAAQRLESLGQVAGGVAHDFNNLLTVILTSAELLTDGPLSEEQKVDLQALTGAAQRARELTTQLLAMSRRQPLTRVRFDLHDQLRALLALLRRIIPANIAIELRDAAVSARVLADRAMLDQVFMNICLNARDAMGSTGEIRFTTRTISIDETTSASAGLAPGRYVEVAVEDTGPGMPPHVVERIFEPFFTTKSEGTGLGLAVAWGITRHHGGTMSCTSEPGRGTVMTVVLPLDEAT